MKMSKFTTSLIALAVSSAFTVQAENSRYIIHVDDNNKQAVKAMAKKLGANIHVDANGFISATFEGKSLNSVKKMMANPVKSLQDRGLNAASDQIDQAAFASLQIEEDQIRSFMSAYSDDVGDPRTEQLTPYSVYQSEANQVTFNANAGMKVCVIDSGLDRSNPDFEWSRITGDNDSGTGNWDEHGGPHGTHVAGTIGAADNNIGVVGMAPGVDMHIIKVFNASGWGYSSDLAHAAQKCTDAGANIISMSLGGGAANSAEENAFDTFTANGGLVVAAAGNDGNSVRSYPAGYESVMMVGGNDADNGRYESSQYPSCSSTKDNCVEITAGGVNVLSTYQQDGATLSVMSAGGQGYASTSMENTGSASGSTYYMGTAESTDSAANGKICVIDRGNITFHDKVQNCENSGGIGAIIINNVAGVLSGTLGDTNATTIPAVGAALEDKSALVAASTASIEISASSYGYMTGTSMATPAVSGVAALVWSNHTECTGTQIRDALKATAADLGDAGHDVYFGHGVVKAKAAHDYLTANGCGGVVTPPGEGGSLEESISSINRRASQTFTVEIPEGMSTFTINTSGGTGDADLYIYQAGSSTAVCKSTSYSNNESCTISNPAAGSWEIEVYAYSRVRNLTLNAQWN
ncbi:S8 family serine peptidase [Thalassomonas viridans]|uniref:S8 family serine peptidase n=1 Tax=Thalassomonas viridans TaxID=137584 RepID=A0AAF0C9S0_9GAMM|nr:S8 family serine peptidase [Thalassomonas viridans]WDE05550.1 S8 family serine peptidase [Thalassomonas viridans]